MSLRAIKQMALVVHALESRVVELDIRRGILIERAAMTVRLTIPMYSV